MEYKKWQTIMVCYDHKIIQEGQQQKLFSSLSSNASYINSILLNELSSKAKVFPLNISLQASTSMMGLLKENLKKPTMINQTSVTKNIFIRILSKSRIKILNLF